MTIRKITLCAAALALGTVAGQASAQVKAEGAPGKIKPSVVAKPQVARAPVMKAPDIYKGEVQCMTSGTFTSRTRREGSTTMLEFTMPVRMVEPAALAPGTCAASGPVSQATRNMVAKLVFDTPMQAVSAASATGGKVRVSTVQGDTGMLITALSNARMRMLLEVEQGVTSSTPILFVKDIKREPSM